MNKCIICKKESEIIVPADQVVGITFELYGDDICHELSVCLKFTYKKYGREDTTEVSVCPTCYNKLLDKSKQLTDTWVKNELRERDAARKRRIEELKKELKELEGD